VVPLDDAPDPGGMGWAGPETGVQMRAQLAHQTGDECASIVDPDLVRAAAKLVACRGQQGVADGRRDGEAIGRVVAEAPGGDAAWGASMTWVRYGAPGQWRRAGAAGATLGRGRTNSRLFRRAPTAARITAGWAIASLCLGRRRYPPGLTWLRAGRGSRHGAPPGGTFPRLQVSTKASHLQAQRVRK
jgi:hypothetical protein